MTKITRAAALAAAVFTAMGSGPAAQAPELALGMIRPDGILTPFAVFDGKTWTAAWPEPQDRRILEGMIERVDSYWREHQRQVPLTWHVVRPGQPALKVNVLQHIVFDEHCAHQVGLLTDLQPRRADSHDKRLAADRVIPITLPLDLSESANRDGWQDLVQLIEPEVQRQESIAIANWERNAERTSLLEPADRRQRVQIKRLYAHREDGHRVLYFEAERQYDKSIWNAPDGEPSMLFVTGWMHGPDGSRPSTTVTQALVTDIDFKSAVRMTPLGILGAGESGLWVGHEHGYEDEAVTLLRISAKGVTRVFSAFIGGC